MHLLVDFLSQLHDNNDREWFHSHQREWKLAQAQYYELTQSLIDGIVAFDPSISGLQVKDCVYRIARDTRFSHDKTPYKNWLGAYIAPRGKKSGFAGYYIHFEPKGEGLIGQCLLTAGLYCPEPAILRSVREEILDNGSDLLREISDSGFILSRSNQLKRTPVGFPSDNQFDDLLRLKDFYIEKPISLDYILSPDLVKNALEDLRLTQPFVARLNRAVEYAFEQAK